MIRRPMVRRAIANLRVERWHRVVMILLAALLVIPASARTSEARRRRAVAPIQVRFLGYVAEEDGAGGDHLQWRVALAGDKVTLDVAELTIPSGSYTSLDVDTALAPYRLKFTVTGRDDDLRRLRHATREQPVRVSGYLRLDPTARFLMLDRVDPIANGPTGSSDGTVHKSPEH